jgi:hypothetical protein
MKGLGRGLDALLRKDEETVGEILKTVKSKNFSRVNTSRARIWTRLLWKNWRARSSPRA